MLIAAGIFAAVIVIVLLLASSKSSAFRFERSTTVYAAAEKIFPLINDFHNWTQWSPWEHLDPNLKRTFSGSPSGAGSRYAWQGNSKAGEGVMEITKATSPSQVVIKLDFIKPFPASNTAEFTMTSSGEATNVVWAMYGHRPFMVKVMDVFVSMDKLIGKDFEKGLASLKAAAER